MVANIYTELVQYEEVGGDLVERLSTINGVHIFQSVIDYYKEDFSKLNRALFYILHTYSVNSKYHVLGQDWLQIKDGIAERVGIDKDETIDPEKPGKTLYQEVVLLQCGSVIRSIQAYIDYQGNRNFKHLIMLKELYEQMFSSALGEIVKSGEVDYDQKNKNKDYATRLLNEIGEWEQKVASDVAALKDGMKEISKGARDKKLSLKLEDNLMTLNNQQ